MISISGYALQEKIRHNRNIDTYSALRRKDKRRVLLKMPNERHLSSDNLAILQHEFHILKQIDVPTIIKAYDFLQNAYAPVLVLEGVEGQLLRSYIHNHELKVTDFLKLALQLVDIIGELHQLKIIHKEIRPANIIIEPDHLTLKLIDLSASTKLSEETFDYLALNSFDEGLAYVSPEQTGRINRPVDYRTDFYSLGISLYEMLTNQLPFNTTDPLELVHCHIAKKPPNILEKRLGIPTMLVAIIDKLLQKMPEERYSSAIGLKSDLLECLNQWESKGDISKFALGLNDKKDQLNISRNLYGRKHQVEQLLHAFERVGQGAKEIVFIAGYSGIGKTSLVKEVHKPIAQHRCYYIQGKFDQLQQNIPYSAIVLAFQNLVKQVLAESEMNLVVLREHLNQSLGKIGQVVIDVIPEVELIIGAQPSVPKLKSTDAQTRFNLVFQNFVRVFAQSTHPLVLFLDDLQWADNSSLNFIENLAQDRETNYLLIIGAYRDNEINKAHPLQLTINNLIKSNIVFTPIMLQPLQLKNIQQLLFDTLSSPLNRIHDLAQCIFDKTQGNPFFINEFIKILYQEKMLCFSYDKGVWEWDLTRILQQSATDNVIDLLTVKIHLLPEGTQEILKLAACFGHKFDFNTLLIISGQTISQTADVLYQAIKAHLICPLEEVYKTVGLVGLDESIDDFNMVPLHYRFAHDRIQQASYELIAEKDRAAIHLKIGRLLLQEKTLTEHDERLFDIMKHFNYCIHLIKNSSEKLRLAKYNLWAGQRAKSASAYYTANGYLSAGSALLNQQHWEKNYALVFQLYKELAVCKYLIGDFAAADRYFTALIEHCRDSLDNLEVYRLKIEMLSALGKHTEALAIGLEALHNFGIKIPKKPNKIHILAAIFAIKFQMRNTPPELIDLLPMVDLKQRAIADLITQLYNSAFITNQQLFVLLTCKNISLSLKHGYTPSTSTCIPAYAFVIMHSLDLYDEAISFVKLYNKLKRKYGSSNLEGKNQFILGSFIEPYQQLISSANRTVTKAFGLCCEAGDLVYSNYSKLLLVLHSFAEGKTLCAVQKHVQASLSFMSRINISDFINVVQFWDYSIDCLENLVQVSPEQISVFENNILHGQNKTEQCFLYSSLTMLHFLLGNFAQAVASGEQHDARAAYDAGLISHLNGKFFHILALFYHLPQLNERDHQSHLKKLKKLALFIEKYAKWCPDNYESYSLLIAAEFEQLQHKPQDALVLYEQAINAAVVNKSILIAAIASEGAGRCCIANKIDRAAKLYLQNSYQYFKEWGAASKTKLLEETYPAYIGSNDNISDSLRYPEGAQTLDILAILKFTQLLSSEIRLDKLLQKFMIIVLENAGAQKSIILTKVNEQWIVEAEGNSEQQLIYLNHATTTEAGLKCPLSMLNYVQRTKKPIIVNDAIQSDLTFKDPYVKREKLRSVLMMPLFYQGQLCRILYLEHKDSSYTFTSGHIDSLQLLCSQAMTSLENAKLYYQATHDPLTGLANRNMFYEIFQQTAQQLSHSQGKIALLFLDLDYFKVINDTLGHDNGDKLLVHIAKILTSVLREGDVAARIGGDEFALMLANFSSQEQITSIIEWLFNEMSTPFHIDDHLVQITASMGVSIFPQDAEEVQTLMKLADTALYQSKEKGRNQFYYYSTELYQEYQRIHGLDKELQKAYDNQEFFLMYQPFYDVNTKKIIGLEALLRWNHPERGILDAGEFITTLEKSPLIIPVSEWILQVVCKQAKVWQDKKIFSGFIAINLSAVQFINHSLSNFVAQTLAETQLSPASIELEITETMFIDYNENLRKEIAGLQKLGVHLVIDDFGTGYSALSYLKFLPVNKIKIDKTFVDNCESDYLDQTIINTITNMAHKLNLTVIAEGVENAQQLQILKDQGVDGFQGYVYSRPLTRESCEILLQEERS